MPTEVRYLTPDDYRSYFQFAGYSFNMEPEATTGMVQGDIAHGDRPAGIFVNGRLAAALLDRRFAVNVNGAPVRANGIGTLASSPETRRRGLVRDMMRWHLAQLRAEGVPLSLLYPFDFRFYNRMGWALGARMMNFGVAPKEFAGYGRPAGTIRQLLTCDKEGIHVEPGSSKEGVIDRLQRVYAAGSARLNLAAKRTYSDWERVFRVMEGIRYVYGWESDAGELEGYHIGRTRAGEHQGDLYTRELFAMTPDAWRGLFWFLSCHDSQIKEVHFSLPPDHQLVELLTNPRHDAKHGQGPMARAVDVVALIAARGTEGVNSGSCVIRVADDLAPWNDGDFAVSRGEEGGPVTAVRLDSPQEFDLSAKIDVFSQLAVGTRSLDEMLQFGLAGGKEGPGLVFARNLFPKRMVMHLEYY